jgi:hypothetical protein
MFCLTDPFIKDDRNVLGIVIVAKDITDQKEVIEAKVFTELATGIAEEEKINAENARCC